jgi:hypothetical protein
VIVVVVTVVVLLVVAVQPPNSKFVDICQLNNVINFSVLDLHEKLIIILYYYRDH